MKRIILLFIAIIFLASCENLMFSEDEATTDPFNNFDFLWKEVDQKYSYFDLKEVDWNDIKVKYRSRLYDGMNEDSLFNILGKMLNELKDDHSNLRSPFNLSRYYIMLRKDDNYNDYTVLKYYMKDDRMETSSFEHCFLEDKQIGYLRYPSFSSSVSSLDIILKRYQNTKGLIIDIRENGGGDMMNVPLFLSHFVNKKTLIGYAQTRKGKEHDEFGDFQPLYVDPKNGVQYLNKPVMILIDRGTYSAATFFSLATKAIPNFSLVGDTTGGGGGMPNGGQLPNGWFYRFTVSRILDTNKSNYAEKGIPPTIPVSFNWSDLTKDEIIEKAAAEILN